MRCRPWAHSIVGRNFIVPDEIADFWELLLLYFLPFLNLDVFVSYCLGATPLRNRGQMSIRPKIAVLYSLLTLTSKTRYKLYPSLFPATIKVQRREETL